MNKKDIVDLVEETSRSYMEYALSTIISRALPDIRDGLKPVQRRIIYAMMEDGLYPEGPHVKCVSIVGDTLKKYHPHGDASVYGTLVNMEQPFNFRYPLVDGQGNFGSVNDAQSPAAPRYTEAKMTDYCKYCVSNIKEDVVDFIDNFDGRYQEPTVLPVPFPNLLCNGSLGIAVGMSTNIPPHNVSEVIDATVMLIKNPNLSVKDIMRYIKGPDFPSGAYIIGKEGIIEAYETGKGSIILQAKVGLEERSDGGKNLVITELPYRVSPDKIEIRIAELAKREENPLLDILEVKNLTDNNKGINLVVELRKDADIDVVVKRLLADTDLQTKFHIDMKVVENREPISAGLKHSLQAFIDFRVAVVTRLLKHRLHKHDDDIHLQEGLLLVLNKIKMVVDLIQSAADRKSASELLQKKLSLSSKQAEYVLDISLVRLTKMGKQSIKDLVDKLHKEAETYRKILSSKDSINDYIIEELNSIKKEIGDDRRTQVVSESEAIELENLSEKEEMLVVITRDGYIKKSLAQEYKNSKNQIVFNKKEQESIKEFFIGYENQRVLFFTNTGKMYEQEVRGIPLIERGRGGVHINSLLFLEGNEYIRQSLVFDNKGIEGSLTFITNNGKVKRIDLKEFSQKGKNRSEVVFELTDGDEIYKVVTSKENQDLCIATNKGYVVRYPISTIRLSSKKTMGSQGIDLTDGSLLVGAFCIKQESTDFIVAITNNGYCKKTLASEYSSNSNRGGRGIKALSLNDEDELFALEIIEDKKELSIITSASRVLTQNIGDIKVLNRVTKGIKIVDLEENEKIVDVVI